MTVEECPQCKGTWLDNPELGEFQKNEYSKCILTERIMSRYYDNQDRQLRYKKDFVENGSLDDLFDFEYE
jgi:Zn-finger nucleic acid-binding protein